MAKRKELLDRYPEPHYADGKRLKILRESLRIGQVELSKLAGIGQVSISRIELGLRPFTKGARNKIWPVMAKLLDERQEEVKSSTPWIRKALEKAATKPKSQDKQEHGGSGFLSALGTPSRNREALMAAYARGAQALASEWSSLTIEQRLQFEKNLLEAQLQDANEIIAGKDAEIATLIKALDAALQANADYAKLFALKGASVAADELQQEIENRQRNAKEDAD